jgi:hypothetical protein
MEGSGISVRGQAEVGLNPGTAAVPAAYADETPNAIYFCAEGAIGTIAWGEALRSSAQPQD